jgi:DNA-binding transcriptional LysR family regulator
MRNLNLDQLRTLIEVVDLGSFTEAAKRLHLTQPAISQQIRELENRCGLQLVERIGKRAFATPAGSDLIIHGRRIMAEAEHALAAVRHHRVRHLLRSYPRAVAAKVGDPELRAGRREVE